MRISSTILDNKVQYRKVGGGGGRKEGRKDFLYSYKLGRRRASVSQVSNEREVRIGARVGLYVSFVAQAGLWETCVL